MQPVFSSTKSKLWSSILSGALEKPFYTEEYVIDCYADLHKLNIEDARDRQNLDLAIQGTSHLTATSARTTMGNVCDDNLRARDKTTADLPLQPGGKMDEKSWKTLGHTSTLTGAEYEPTRRP